MRISKEGDPYRRAPLLQAHHADSSAVKALDETRYARPLTCSSSAKHFRYLLERPSLRPCSLVVSRSIKHTSCRMSSAAANHG
jgi:hypothetical protein